MRARVLCCRSTQRAPARRAHAHAHARCSRHNRGRQPRLIALPLCLTFCPMPTITPVCLGRPTMLGKTARGASSPAKPACVCCVGFLGEGAVCSSFTYTRGIRIKKFASSWSSYHADRHTRMHTRARGGDLTTSSSKAQQGQQGSTSTRNAQQSSPSLLTLTMPEPLSHTRALTWSSPSILGG